MAPTNFSPADTSNQKLNSEISDEIHAAIAYLTRPFQQLHTLHTPRDENNQNQEAGKDLEAGQVEDGVGVRIITLAGQNSGATMNLPGSSQNTIDAGEGGQRESVVSSNHTTINIHINNNIKEVNNSILYNCSSKFRYPVVRLPEFHIDINNNIQELNNSIFYNSSCGFRYPGVCPDVSMGRKRWFTEFLNSAVDVDDFLNSGVDVDDQASCVEGAISPNSGVDVDDQASCVEGAISPNSDECGLSIPSLDFEDLCKISADSRSKPWSLFFRKLHIYKSRKSRNITT